MKTVEKQSPPERLKTLLPEVWALMKPRRNLLLLGALADDHQPRLRTRAAN